MADEKPTSTSDDTAPIGASGSRWEPGDRRADAPTAEVPAAGPAAGQPAEHPYAEHPYAEHPYADPASGRRGPRAWFSQTRLVLAGAIAGLLLVGGLGGFLVGHATAGHDGPGDRSGFGRDVGDRSGFPGGQDGQRGPGGFQPGPGQQPGLPGGDDDGSDGPDGSRDGSHDGSQDGGQGNELEGGTLS